VVEIKESEGDLTFEDDSWGKISAQGVTYLDAGKGPAVLLLHAFPLSSAMWRRQIEALHRDFRVVAPDFRGFGSTPGFVSEPSVDQMADDAVALLDHLKIKEPVVVGGLSMGGYVALAFARRHASRLRALILADTQSGAEDPTAAANRDKMIEFASKNPSLAIIERILPAVLSPDTLAKRPEVVDAVRHIASVQAPVGIINALRALRDRPNATPYLKEITVPTLVIVGREDAVTPLATAEKLTASIRGARLVIIEKAGHLSNLEQPEGFNQAMRVFLTSL
jgi:pimeloyl-ACP methyl ester carboxylesterase